MFKHNEWAMVKNSLHKKSKFNLTGYWHDFKWIDLNTQKKNLDYLKSITIAEIKQHIERTQECFVLNYSNEFSDVICAVANSNIDGKVFSFEKKKYSITFHPFSMVSKKWKLSRYEWPTATWWKRNKRCGENENAEEACINIFGSYANGRALVEFHNLWYSKSERMSNGNHNNVPIIRYQMNSSQAISKREDNNEKKTRSEKY